MSEVTALTHPELRQLYDVIGLHHSHPVSVLKHNFTNIKRFSDHLHAIEREFFMAPGPESDEPGDEGLEPEPDCLLNCFGKNTPDYVEQFREALPQLIPTHEVTTDAGRAKIAAALVEEAGAVGFGMAPEVAASMVDMVMRNVAKSVYFPPDAEDDMVAVPRAILGAASCALSNKLPPEACENLLAATRYYQLQKRSAIPTAVVDAGDDGQWADILPDRTVHVGQTLYAYPPKADKLLAAAEHILAILQHPTKSVTVFDQERLEKGVADFKKGGY